MMEKQKTGQGRIWFELIANSLLSLSALILLTDVAPNNWSRDSFRKKRAVATLVANRHGIFDPTAAPAPIDLSQTPGAIFDTQAVCALKELVRKHSSYSATVPWDRVVGISSNAMIMPVG